MGWLAQAAPWVGMIVGATIGGAAYVRIGEPAIWAPIALAGVLAAGSTLIPQRDCPSDPAASSLQRPRLSLALAGEARSYSFLCLRRVLSRSRVRSRNEL